MGDVGDYWNDHRDYVRRQKALLHTRTCTTCGEEYETTYQGKRSLCLKCKDAEALLAAKRSGGGA